VLQIIEPFKHVQCDHPILHVPANQLAVYSLDVTYTSFSLARSSRFYYWWPRVELDHRHADFEAADGCSRGLLINHL
jgi:hypothetical protein